MSWINQNKANHHIKYSLDTLGVGGGDCKYRHLLVVCVLFLIDAQQTYKVLLFSLLAVSHVTSYVLTYLCMRVIWHEKSWPMEHHDIGKVVV